MPFNSLRSGLHTRESGAQVKRLAIAVALAALAVRAFWPGIDRSLWLDEQMIAMNIRDRDLAGLAGLLDHNQSAPLAWLWVERLMYVAFGPAEWALRLQPFVFGVAAVVVAWWYGSRWLGPIAAPTLVALVGFNYAAIGYSAELKHYSADLLWAFLLIALARWVIDDPRSYRRYLWWWGAALVGSWLSNGAILATPAIGLVLAAVTFLAGDRASAGRVFAQGMKAVLPGLAWLASFAAHYVLSLRPATQSNYLNEFWGGLGFPPPDGNIVQVLAWYPNQVKYLLHNTLYLDIGLEPNLLARSIFVVFSLLFLAGMVITFRRGVAFGLVLCVPLLTSVLLAQFRVIPLFGRLALWLAPAIFVAVAHAIDWALEGASARQSPASGALEGARAGQSPGRWAVLRWLAPAAALLLLVPFVNSVRAVATPPDFDDRAAIAWLRERHRPGDLTLLVATASRAPEWYDPDNRLRPRRMVVNLPPGPDCHPAQLRSTLTGHRRVLVYAGARLEPYKETYRILETQLAQLGTVTDRATFSVHGITYVVELPPPVPGITYVVELSPAVPAPSDSHSGSGSDCIRLY